MRRSLWYITNRCSKVFIFQQKNIFLQSFSIPQTLIYYITQNVSKIVHQKLFSCCKYFKKNKNFIIFTDVTAYGDTWSETIKDLNDIPAKIWVTGKIFKVNSSQIFPHIFPKLFYVNVKKLEILYQNISYKEFLFLVLCKKIENFFFCRSEIKNADETWVELSNILEKLPIIREFTYVVNDAWFCTLKSAIKMAEMSIITTLKSFDIGFVIPTRFSSSKEYKIFKNKHSFAKFKNYKQFNRI